MPDWATRTERSTEATIAGSFVATVAWFDPGSAAFTSPSSPGRDAATSSRFSGRKPARSGMARHWASTGRPPARGPSRSAASATSGPTSLNEPPGSFPARSSGSPSQ